MHELAIAGVAGIGVGFGLMIGAVIIRELLRATDKGRNLADPTPYHDAEPSEDEPLD